MVERERGTPIGKPEGIQQKLLDLPPDAVVIYVSQGDGKGISIPLHDVIIHSKEDVVVSPFEGALQMVQVMDKLISPEMISSGPMPLHGHPHDRVNHEDKFKLNPTKPVEVFKKHPASNSIRSKGALRRR